jgi:hypothetical protein
MEFRDYIFEFLPSKGGPQSQHMRFAFKEPIAQASAVLTGYSASFVDGDHELGQLSVQLGTQIVNHAPDGPEVVVNALLGLRDFSRSCDDRYTGKIHVCLIAIPESSRRSKVRKMSRSSWTTRFWWCESARPSDHRSSVKGGMPEA